ncbi:APC family permease [Kineosporia sp. J2-2]|uniref:APC family permease n=1 Tax=Kineosporia corallincola TaxID=2835133 RepID=A0ABS5TKC2_9ACTN|nr:APC family permease [Kineosporia corallincola]MBT0771545.1 APC family permease [Kineosporia corallincola]
MSISSPPHDAPADTPGGTLGARHLILLVIAAAGPLGVAVGNLPGGLFLGNGVGLPSAYLVAAVAIGCLAVGFVAMNRAVPDGGGFAGFVTAGLGRPWGLGAAYVTSISYWAGSLSLAAGVGYYGNLIGELHGFSMPWWAYSLAGFALTFVLGRRAADLSARVLVTLMVAEVLVVIGLDIAILADHGFSAFPLESFSPHQALSGNLGPALMIGFTSFIGIESAILYTREARRPEKSVPMATYVSVVMIGGLYILTAWLVVGALGAKDAVATATEQQGNLVFVLATQEVGEWFSTVVQVFFVTSLLACLIALHNASARYIQVLGSQKALPARLGVLHPRFQAPANASDVLIVIGVVLFVVFAVFGANPYIGVGSSLTGLFTLGIVAVQAVVALATVVYFRGSTTTNRWVTVVVPAVGGIIATVAAVAIVINYDILVGSTSVLGRLVPLVLLIALLAGPLVARRTNFQPKP